MDRDTFTETLEQMAQAADAFADGCRQLARNLGADADIRARLQEADQALTELQANLRPLQRAVGTHPTLEAVDPSKHSR